jgi:hypothetical protein
MTVPGRSVDQCLPAISFRDSKIDARNVVIEDNVLLSHTDAILVKRVTGVTIQGNTARLVAPDCGSPVGVRTIAVEQAVVEGNDVHGYRTGYEAE